MKATRELTDSGSDVGLNAVQLKRLAEAVDSDRRGGEVHVVMRVSGKPPFDVAVVTEDAGHADEVATKKTTKTKKYRRFGPYQSVKDEIDRKKVNQFAVTVCHEPDSDDCETHRDGKGFPRMAAITQVEVVMNTNDGEEPFRVDCGHREPNDPGENAPADAIFIGMAAIDKFWIPYLERVYGPEVATDRRRALIDKVIKAGADQGEDFTA